MILYIIVISSFSIFSSISLSGNLFLILSNDRIIEFPQGVENMKIIYKKILKRILFNALHYKQ
jgi:hypothetical protein